MSMLELTDIRYLQAGTDGKSRDSDSELLAYCRNEWKADDPTSVAARLSNAGQVARRGRRLVGWLVTAVPHLSREKRRPRRTPVSEDPGVTGDGGTHRWPAWRAGDSGNCRGRAHTR